VASCPNKSRTRRATLPPTFYPWVRPSWIVFASTLGCATLAIAQEPAPKKSSTAPNAQPASDALKFANGLLRQKKFELAAEEYERILGAGAAGTERHEALFGLGTARLSIGRYRDARESFDAFLNGAPNDPRTRSAQYRLGELSYLLGDLPAAREALEKFTSAGGQHPSLESAWTYLGDTCFGLEDMPQAKAAYERSIAAYPQGRTADRARYGLARTLAVSGERDKALVMLEALTKKGSPDWADRCWLQIGLIQESAGRLPEAVQAYQSLERIAPSSALAPEARLHRAIALVGLGRKPEAEGLLEVLATSGPEATGPRAALELATIQLEGQHPEAASATLEGALKRYPESPAVPALWFRSAEALLKQKRPAEAEVRFLKVAEGFPDDAWADDALLRAAQSALDRGDFGAAGRVAEKFPAKFGRSALRSDARLIEARAAASSGQPKDAVTILESLVGAASSSAKADGASKDGSAKASAAAPALSPALAQSARFHLALAYRALGRSAEADSIFAELSKGTAGPITADAQFLVGQSHLDAGRFAEAVAPLEQYLAANPRGDVAEFAMAHLVTARIGLGQTEAAWKMLANLGTAFPDSASLPPARLRVAEAALRDHQAERAAEQFRLAIGPVMPKPIEASSKGVKPSETISPALQVRAYRGLGRALSELGKQAEAAAAFRAALALAPTDPIAPEVALAEARALENGSQTDAALKAYSAIQDRFAKSDQAAQAGLARARLLGKAGRHGEASGELERLISDPHRRESLQEVGVKTDALLAEWGWSLVDADKPAEADRAFARLLKEHPESPFGADARFNLAESANLKQNYLEVVRLLTPLATVKTVNAVPAGAEKIKAKANAGQSAPADSSRRLLPAVLYRLGRTQVELKDWTAAIATFDRLLTDFPENSYGRDARYLRAECALQAGDGAGALAGFSALLGEPPAATDPKGWVTTIRVKQIESWIALKKWKEALKSAQAMKTELTDGDPLLPDVDFASGQALVGLARLEEARAAFQRVIDSSGKGELAARALLMRGEAYFHQEKLHEALRDFLKVDILYDTPKWQAAALLEAGKVYERLDQWADAAETYERLLARFPKEAPASEAKSRRAAASSRAALNGSVRKR
jgi:cellulose synthase operon protein C